MSQQQTSSSPPKCSIALFCCHFDYNVIQPTQSLKRTYSSKDFKNQKKKQRFNRQRRSLRHKQNSQISGIQNRSFNYSSEQSEFRFRQNQNPLGMNLITPDKNSETYPLDKTIINQRSSLQKISFFQAQKIRKQKNKMVRQECISQVEKNCNFLSNQILSNQGQRQQKQEKTNKQLQNNKGQYDKLEHYFQNGKKNMHTNSYVNLYQYPLSDSNTVTIKSPALKKSSQLDKKNQTSPYNSGFMGQQKKVAFQFPNCFNPENKLRQL